MRLTVVGCAGSFPGPRSAASCYLLQADDADGRTWNVVLDLGNGALGPLQTYLDPVELDAVGLSHLHPDHMADVASLYVYLRYRPNGDPREPLPVHGPFGTTSRIGDVYGLEPGETMAAQLAVHVWQPGRPVVVGPLSLVPFAVEHPIPAYGVRVTGPSEADPGRQVTLAYSGDTDACDGLAALADGVDLLLCEAAFLEGQDVARGIHLTGRRAGEVARDCRVGRLVVTHVPAWHDPEDAVAEAREVYDGPVEAARQGLVLAV